MTIETLSGWGRFPAARCDTFHLREPGEAAPAVARLASLIARGNGRAYGDAALNPEGVLSTLRLDRLTGFDPASGIVSCESGLTLADLLRFAVPRGFFPPVTPGTKFVTIGGMIAADAHGKNHHAAGTFGRHVISLDLLTADGAVRTCSRETEADLFRATLGGMGLTGIVLAATFRLIRIDSALIRQETLRTANLAEAMAAFEASTRWTYSVGWVDCAGGPAALGRSLVFRGEHAAEAEVAGDPLRPAPRRGITIPPGMPAGLVNRWSVRAFNALYWHAGAPGTRIVDYDRYFYPLDALAEWNRLYGPHGFVQYQFVLPLAASRDGLTLLLERIAAAGGGSFLAVLKLFGPEGDGFLSFPMEGYTLALDFPVTRPNLELLDELDAIVADHGGRIYLAKDARAAAATVRRGYPGLDRFLAVRRAVDPAGRFASLQSRRLGL